MPLDRAEEGLVTDDGRHLLCRTHGAIFAPESGLCLAGPCRGESLESIAIVRAGSGWAVKT